MTELPLDKQKPLDVTKNKPEEKKRRNLNEERERQQQQQNRRGGASFPGGAGSMGGPATPMQRPVAPAR